MKALIFFVTVSLAACAIASAGESQRLKITLTDGSHLLAAPIGSSLAVVSDALRTDLEIPYALIEELEAERGRVRLALVNGDRLTVRLAQSALNCSAVFGEITIPIEHLAMVEFDKPRVPPTQAGAPQLDYAGLRWDLWRTQWCVKDERLTAIGKIRPGFQYGHGGKGRGGMVITGNGDPEWRDYEVAFDFQLKPASPEFFHAYVPGETRGISVFFRAKSLTESWNQPDTGYTIAINPNGTWTIVGYDGWHMPGNGWSTSKRVGKLVKLATGKSEAPLNDGPNRLRLRVVGSTVTVWINNAKLTEFTHQSGGEMAPIPYGGFGVHWRYESLGWIGNLEVERLPRARAQRSRKH